LGKTVYVVYVVYVTKVAPEGCEMNRKRTLQQAAEAQRLQDLGVPLEVDDQSDFVVIRQVAESSALELTCGATGFIIDVRITSTFANFSISDVDLLLPWPNPSFYWLSDPAETADAARGYKFTSTDAPFEYNTVINHYINPRRIFTRGRPIQGLLLGFGLTPIPAGFKQGMSVPAGLTVVDQFDNEHRQEVDLRIDRLVGRRSRRTKRKPIFEKGEKIAALEEIFTRRT
jgi:hypothetical protein